MNVIMDVLLLRFYHTINECGFTLVEEPSRDVLKCACREGNNKILSTTYMYISILSCILKMNS